MTSIALLGVLQLAVPCLMSVAAARHLSAPEASLLALLEDGAFTARVEPGPVTLSATLGALPQVPSAEVRVDALNHALRDIPEDRIRDHVCFGSWHVTHVSDAALADIVDLMLSVRAGAYSI